MSTTMSYYYAAVNMAVRTFAGACLLWTLVWATVGATTSGKAWYAQLTATLGFRDIKGGLPLVVIAAPILLAAAAIQLLATRDLEVTSSSPSRFTLLSLARRLQKRFFCRGDVNFTNASAIIILPCISYAICSTYRHFQGYDSTSDLNERLMDAANAQGMAALIAMALLFLPVARYSAMLRVLNWSPACAIQLHIWTGRLVVACSLLHGGLHLWRYKYATLLGEDIIALLLPPGPCWTMRHDNHFTPSCRNPETDCTCYHLFRNLTGFVAGIGLLVITLSSLNAVRRRMYSMFYKIHVVAGPLVIGMIILHYNRAILYMAGGLLFYAASSLPVLVESKWRQRRQAGVRIVSSQVIAADSADETGIVLMPRQCVSLTVETSDLAMAQFRAGQHIRLRAPAISAKAHPFSINLVPDQSNQLRVVFRVLGPFTSALTSYLESPDAILHMEGYHGAANRVDQALQHDVIVIVAGGIGITSYLSLLHRIHSNASRYYPRRFQLRKVVLHWMCRDASLVEYVTREYLDPLRRLPSCRGLNIKVMIHRTNRVKSDNGCDSINGTFSDVENPQDDLLPVNYRSETDTLSAVNPDGVPFTPSHFAPVSKLSYRRNLIPFGAFVLIAALGLQIIWYFYTKVQSGDEVMTRLWGPIAVIMLGIVIAVAANVMASQHAHDDEPLASAEWTALSTSGHDALELSQIVTSADGDDNSEGVADAVVPVETTADGQQALLIEEHDGRPSIHLFMNVFDDARLPAMFACGPEPLLSQVRVGLEERCAARIRQCIKGGSKIALYEESFQT